MALRYLDGWEETVEEVRALVGRRVRVQLRQPDVGDRLSVSGELGAAVPISDGDGGDYGVIFGVGESGELILHADQFAEAHVSEEDGEIGTQTKDGGRLRVIPEGAALRAVPER